ncbi:MAG: non-homologous end-joining DNA ligase [Smithella sp.]
MELKDYKAKRQFEKTPEPRPDSKFRTGGGELIFVIHKHAARALHYDLRLEMDGVLKSWAVPKGPSLNPAEKRLAVMVEDHPLDYQDFEGVIPEHNYGAGSVIIWDRGSYSHPSAKDRKENENLLLEGLKKGNLKFILHGEKLRGEFALVRTKRDERSWLLLKKKDQYATAEDILRDNHSVLSTKTLEEVAEADPEQSLSKSKIDQIRFREVLEEEDLKAAPIRNMPHNIQPMLATLIKQPFDHPDWIFEVKWDGYRALAEVRDGKVSLYSRNGIGFEQRFAPIYEALKKLRFEAVLDGEIVVLNDQGYPDFQKLQYYQKSPDGFLVYYIFDLLYLEGHDLMTLPLLSRKEILKKILPVSPHLKFNDHVNHDGIMFFNAAGEKNLEGIVAKRAQSFYQTGKRSRDWLKIKTQQTQEGIIGGFTEPRGARKNFGALVLGVYEGEDLIYIGHTGGGFGEKKLDEIQNKLNSLITKTCPFKIKPKTNTPVVWVKPELVCEVAFHGWTGEGLMRQPVFLRLREDKNAREVVREEQLSSLGGDLDS